ncbi:hypothetical protein NP590_12710 [Methylomonas sp. SURF-2]|uniref:Uncharacterized protein n=1 Tax=Methylomonas subterranea TaxID=2952225 RepID=A0ABT1THN4_9GAMM|nr:hypothetical protein [Methylomonas sp. SURF-2]MCQ8104969.1 hypothetical protein [Methylomonas sp. SURF-2]
MKTVDFFCLDHRLIKPLILGSLLSHALAAAAEPPTPADFAKADKLVLTLSDKWLDPNAQNQPRAGNSNPANKPLSEPAKLQDTPIGCDMDVTPLESSDSSFANRVVGKCKLTLRY